MHASRFRDHETGAHIERVSRFCHLLALAIGVPEEQAQLIATAAPMHDLGKIGIPDSVLGKPGPLTRAEREVMQTHTIIGAEILSNPASDLIDFSREIALTHHERWDGSGYPNGLRGPEIPLSGRIVTIADHYDALRSARPYKPAWTHDYACKVMLEGDGRTSPDHFDPGLLDAFRHLAPEFERIFGQYSDGE